MIAYSADFHEGVIGLIAGNGRFPLLFAKMAKDKGIKILSAESTMRKLEGEGKTGGSGCGRGGFVAGCQESV